VGKREPTTFGHVSAGYASLTLRSVARMREANEDWIALSLRASHDEHLTA
jgi:hypothetical protein